MDGQISARFSSAFKRGSHTVWSLRGARTDVVLHQNGSYRVMYANADYMRNSGGSARTFKTLEKAMVAAVEHAGG